MPALTLWAQTFPQPVWIEEKWCSKGHRGISKWWSSQSGLAWVGVFSDVGRGGDVVVFHFEVEAVVGDQLWSAIDGVYFADLEQTGELFSDLKNVQGALGADCGCRSNITHLLCRSCYMQSIPLLKQHSWIFLFPHWYCHSCCHRSRENLRYYWEPCSVLHYQLVGNLADSCMKIRWIPPDCTQMHREPLSSQQQTKQTSNHIYEDIFNRGTKVCVSKCFVRLGKLVLIELEKVMQGLEAKWRWRSNWIPKGMPLNYHFRLERIS